MSDATTAAEDPCAADNSTTYTSLRIASVFVILVTSLIGTMAPIVSRRISWVPRPVFDFAKYFGSGVIVATAFIHLLAPAFDELGSECLTGVWQDYDWAPAIAMIAVYFIFFAEIATYREGARRLARLGVKYSTHADPEAEHGHSHEHRAMSHGTQDAGGLIVDRSATTVPDDIEALTALEKGKIGGSSSEASSSTSAAVNELDATAVEYDVSTSEGLSQLIAVAVLEFGVMLHSIIIGLTLAVNQEFITLFVVIIFHQMFEGLGLGSRLSQLRLPSRFKYAPYVAGVVYSICTPIGIAVGLGIRESYNGNGATANAVSGVLDAFSAGILLYTGLVELMGHEILLNPRMMKAGAGKMAYVFCCMLLGSGLMALLGRWA